MALTVGPSAEAPDSVNNVGVAAHIAAAAGGRGARRYDASMSPEERSSIENGFWLCQTCAKEIDAADPQASAVHIAHYLARVPSFGTALARGLTEQRAQFLEAEKAIKAVEAHTEAGTRELNGAYYRAVSVVAQAKAFLAVKGVVVRDRKAPVRKPKALAVVPPSASPAVRPSSPGVPAPAPTPMPIPEAA